MLTKDRERRFSELEMYYLAAIPDGRVLERAGELQRDFSLKYQVYNRELPPLHVTLGILYIPRNGNILKDAINLLRPVLKDLLPFRLTVKGTSCFPPPYKSVNLKVVSTGKLRRISREVIKTLQPRGIKCHPMEGWDYHISLVNTTFADREWTEAEYLEACQDLGREKIHLACRVRHFQLWLPEFPPLQVLADFTRP